MPEKAPAIGTLLWYGFAFIGCAKEPSRELSMIACSVEKKRLHTALFELAQESGRYSSTSDGLQYCRATTPGVRSFFVCVPRYSVQ